MVARGNRLVCEGNLFVINHLDGSGLRNMKGAGTNGVGDVGPHRLEPGRESGHPGRRSGMAGWGIHNGEMGGFIRRGPRASGG